VLTPPSLGSRLRSASAHGIVSGLAISFAGLLVLRINPLFAVQDLPDRMADEVRSLTFLHDIDGYDVTLVLLLMVPLVVALFGAFARRQTAPVAAGPARHTSMHLFLAGLVWFLTVFLVDLVVLDWGVYATLHLPALGVEHLLSPEAVSEFQSYGFHAAEHFAHPNSYLAVVIGPVILALVLIVTARIRRKRHGSAPRDS
jgi:hypothetical protein